jgi:uncharacterized membrane protein
MNASSVHPLFVHFPIALFTTALICDLFLLVRTQWAWLDKTAMLLYLLSTVSAILAAVSGKLAANHAAPLVETHVFELVEAHGDWAFGAAIAMVAATLGRLEARHRDRESGKPSRHKFRVLALALAFAAGAVLWQTAERGGALVYRHGVGVDVERALGPSR